MTVYVVYYHNYNASCNVGVFDSLQKAEVFIAERLPEWDQVNYDIQTWEVL